MPRNHLPAKIEPGSCRCPACEGLQAIRAFRHRKHCDFCNGTGLTSSEERLAYTRAMFIRGIYYVIEKQIRKSEQHRLVKLLCEDDAWSTGVRFKMPIPLQARVKENA